MENTCKTGLSCSNCRGRMAKIKENLPNKMLLFCCVNCKVFTMINTWQIHGPNEEVERNLFEWIEDMIQERRISELTRGMI